MHPYNRFFDNLFIRLRRIFFSGFQYLGSAQTFPPGLQLKTCVRTPLLATVTDLRGYFQGAPAAGRPNDHGSHH